VNWSWGAVLALIAPPIVGGVVGFAALGGLVWSQTQAPETNPASEEILVYGD